MKTAFPLFIIIILSGCSDSGREPQELVIMSWNVQNFFDDTDNGTEYYEFDPSNGEWTYDNFSRKSSALADVVTASVKGGPDIVLLQEIENFNALRHLNENGLKASGYKYSMFFPTEGSAIGIGVLSRYPVTEALNHAVNYNGSTAGRNIAELHIALPDGREPIVIFVNHWKSKLGGAEETEPLRIAAAELLYELMTAPVRESHGSLVLAAGDFNESHDEYSRTGGLYPTAVRIVQAGISAQLPGVLCSGSAFVDASGEQVFFNPWSGTSAAGSYYYDGGWETIDQFFLGSGFFDGKGYEYSGFRTAVLGFNTDSEGRPLKWHSSTGTGCSDHLPVVLTLRGAD